jgi:UDP-glucose 4-epimerase
MTTWLVTGGAGFIGSHLCDALVARGDTVRVLDDLSTGRRTNLPSGVTLLEGDVADPERVGEALEGADGCFHLAAVASVEKGMTDWLGTHRTNLTGTITVFEMIRRQGRRIPVVYASSAAVYGDVAALPITEATPCRPLSAYGADKYGCELHARVAGVAHGIPSMGLRFFNVFGPRQDPQSPYSGVISIFCQRILHGQPIAIFGDGLQTRDFIYVGDIVRALIAAMERSSDAAPVFNVCSGTPSSVEALATLIADLAGRSLDVQKRPPRVGEIRHSIGDPAPASDALGLLGRTSLRDGLAQVMAWLAGQT